MAVWQQLNQSISQFITKGLIIVIHGYRWTFGSLLGGQCRFYPSCSHYMEEAIHEHGVTKGTRLGLWRLVRCTPFQAGGFDPVPPKKHNKAG